MQQSHLFGPFMSCEETKVLQKWTLASHINILYSTEKPEGAKHPSLFCSTISGMEHFSEHCYHLFKFNIMWVFLIIGIGCPRPML